MKGLYNNKDASGILLDLKNSISNKLCAIYNMGYREGFADGQHDSLQKLIDIVLTEGRTDEHTD